MRKPSRTHEPDAATRGGDRRLPRLLPACVALLAASALAFPASVQNRQKGQTPGAGAESGQRPQKPSLKLSASSDFVSVCPDEDTPSTVQLSASGLNTERAQVVYNWEVSGGTIHGDGPVVTWGLYELEPGTYTATVTASFVSPAVAVIPRQRDSVKVVVRGCPEPTCPKLLLACPKEVEEGQPLSLGAIARSGRDRPRGQITHAWSLTAGKVVAGQGTPSVRVDTRGLGGQTLTATYEMGGYDLTCRETCQVYVKSGTQDGNAGTGNTNSNLGTGNTNSNAGTGTTNSAPPATPTPSPSPPLSPIAETSPAPAPTATPPGGTVSNYFWPAIIVALAALGFGAFLLARKLMLKGGDKIKGGERGGGLQPAPPQPPPVTPPRASKVPPGRVGSAPPRRRGSFWPPWRKKHEEATLGGGVFGGVFKEGEDELKCSVFAPFSAAPGESFLVQAFAHLAEHAPQLAGLAREAEPKAERRGAKDLGRVARGAELVFHLQMPGLEIDEPAQTIVWKGEIESATFGVNVPEGFNPRRINCKLTVSHAGVPLGHVKFVFEVAAAPQPAGEVERLNSSSDFVRYKQAFISYASKDRAEVLRRVQMLSLVKIKYFQDLLSLRPGDRWSEELCRFISQSDVFFLFWSAAAHESERVKEEVLYALRCKGGDDEKPPEIVPVILQGPPEVPPPDYLPEYHFNDPFAYFVKAETAMRQEGRQK